MKICCECKQQKDESEFYKNKRYPSGLEYYCKKCWNKRRLKYQQTEIGKLKHSINNKKYSNTPKGIIVRRNISKKYYLNNKFKKETHDEVLIAIKKGILIKPDTCSICNKQFPKKFIHGHHEDYSKPLDVIWLCFKCHWNLHNKDKILCSA